jgi:hypothetical protein
MAESKTARASSVKVVTKTLTPEEQATLDAKLVKQLRYDVSNGIHATQEGAKALLRAYDAALAETARLTEERS